MKKESSYFIICFFLLLCLLQLYLFLDRANFFSGKTGTVFTVVSSYYVLTLIAINIFSIFIFLNFIKQTNADIEFFQLTMFPSVLIPLLSFLLEIAPYFYYLSNQEASFGNVAIPEFMDNVFLLVLISRVFVVTGIVLSRKKEFFLLKYHNLAILRDLKINNFKNIITSKIPFFFILSFGIFIGLARIGFNFGYRRGDHLELIIGDNVLSIIGVFVVSFISIIYSCQYSLSLWIIVIFNTLPSILSSSRGALMLPVLYIFGSSLAGKKYPKYLFFLLPFVIIITSFWGLTSRGSSGISGGLNAILSTKLYGSLNTLLMSNNNLGVLSNAFYFKDSSQDFIESMYHFFLTILPIPTDVYLSSSINIAQLKGFSGIGIPMPSFGDLYFYSGWSGLVLISFLIGWLCGILEAKLLFYKKNYNHFLWQHILLLLSSSFFFLYSYHNTFRASSRIFVYTWLFVWFVGKISSDNKIFKKLRNSNENS
jgi:hypothetical protein